MTRHPYIHQHDIKVTVNNHLVTHRGTVDSGFEKEMAAKTVSRVRGVAEVIDNLELHREWQPKEDWEIIRDIKDELRWSPFVDEVNVSIDVMDGVATFTGEVDTLRERHIATENAYEGGARQVRNRLKVKYGPEKLRP
jgi:osmotically-inducible protein OsmY